MNLAPIFAAPPLIQLHLATVMIAVVLCFPIFLMRKGTPAHRLMGRIWVVSMLTTACVSLGIRTTGGLSFIHIFSLITLVSAPYAVWAIRRGRVDAHRSAMISLTFGGIGIAGAFALGQGRLLHAVIWGG